MGEVSAIMLQVQAGSAMDSFVKGLAAVHDNATDETIQALGKLAEDSRGVKIEKEDHVKQFKSAVDAVIQHVTTALVPVCASADAASGSRGQHRDVGQDPQRRPRRRQLLDHRRRCSEMPA
eukprot:173723-Pyramimonas_sp.AAC.1